MTAVSAEPTLQAAEDGVSHPLLVVRNLTTGYTDVPLIEDLGLSVSANEIVALLGANGAGKSTLLRALIGLLPTWTGSIILDGVQISALPPHERVRAGLGMVLPGRALFNGMSVIDNLRIGCYLDWRRSVERERLEQVFSIFPELVRLKAAIAGRLSGGEQQMVALGRALMSRPKLLLIDELSLGLAPVVVERLMPALELICRTLKTPVVFVEQDVARAVEFADRAYVLALGRVVMHGRPKTLVNDRRLIEAYMGLGEQVASRANIVSEN